MPFLSSLKYSKMSKSVTRSASTERSFSSWKTKLKVKKTKQEMDFRQSLNANHFLQATKEKLWLNLSRRYFAQTTLSPGEPRRSAGTGTLGSLKVFTIFWYEGINPGENYIITHKKFCILTNAEDPRLRPNGCTKGFPKKFTPLSSSVQIVYHAN